MSRDEVPTRPPPRMHIARIAVERSNPIPREDPPFTDEHMARMMAQLEGNLLAKMADMREEQDSERPSRVHLQIDPPRAAEEKKHWLHSVGGTLTGIAAVLAGLTALTASSAALWNQLKPPDHTAEIKALQQEVKELKRFKLLAAQQFEMQSTYDTDFRNRVRGYFIAGGIKVPPAAGEVEHDPADLLPAPLVDSHRVTRTFVVQPRDALPLPPMCPSEFETKQ